MAKKSERQSVFSAAVVRAIAAVCKEACADGTCVTRETVAKRLLKSKAFTQDNLTLLTVMVGEAVKHGEVPGFSSRRGPGGGIYSIAAAEKAEQAAA